MESKFIEKLNFNEKGLIPAIAQDWLDGAILMMAWMNITSIQKTIKTREVHYWSRSRDQLWHKGSTSGNFQLLKAIRYDCDADVILLTIEQIGDGACHTGARSCFYDEGIEIFTKRILSSEPPADSLSELYKVIEHRRSNPEKNSYTNRLLDCGDNLILKKIGEESAEFIMACKDEDKAGIANEAADLIFHLQVSLAKHGVSWREILEVLEKRRGGPRRS